MFRRRHPFLFAFLVFSGIVSFCIVLTVFAAVLAVGSGGEWDFGERIGVIEINGLISDSQFVVNSLAKFRKDSDIKAIVLRVDSPGGAVGPSQEIYREVEKTVKHKVVVVSMGSVAASGGYYVSACASGIMANPATITGSIGVILAYTNFQGLFNKVGLTPVVIKSGKFKDMGSPVKELTPEEREMLTKTVDAMYGQFLAAVAKGRKIPMDKLKPLADGRIFIGSEALKLGLVDKLGNMRDAIAWAADLAGLSGDIRVQYARPSAFGLLGTLLESSAAVVQQVKASASYSNFAFLYKPL